MVSNRYADWLIKPAWTTKRITADNTSQPGVIARSLGGDRAFQFLFELPVNPFAKPVKVFPLAAESLGTSERASRLSKQQSPDNPSDRRAAWQSG